MLAAAPIAGAPFAGSALIVSATVPLGVPSGLPGIVMPAIPIQALAA